MCEHKCKVDWCESPIKSKKHKYCEVHSQYKDIASHATSRPWLMYKVEKVVSNQLICESCGLDLVKEYPDKPVKALFAAVDVDHQLPKHMGGVENPTNYKLLCKVCHVVKSYQEGDFLNKKYRNIPQVEKKDEITVDDNDKKVDL
jgi:hypothetical protein